MNRNVKKKPESEQIRYDKHYMEMIITIARRPVPSECSQEHQNRPDMTKIDLENLGSS